LGKGLLEVEKTPTRLTAKCGTIAYTKKGTNCNFKIQLQPTQKKAVNNPGRTNPQHIGEGKESAGKCKKGIEKRQRGTRRREGKQGNGIWTNALGQRVPQSQPLLKKEVPHHHKKKQGITTAT